MASPSCHIMVCSLYVGFSPLQPIRHQVFTVDAYRDVVLIKAG